MSINTWASQRRNTLRAKGVVQTFLDYIVVRLTESSTRIGIITAILGVVVIAATTADVKNIAGILIVLVGAIAAAFPDKRFRKRGS
jgi:hypothetical protein